MRPSNNLENKTLSDVYWRVQLVYRKVQTHSSRLVLKGKIDKEIPKSSRSEFLEKFLANNFALSDEEDNTSEPMNREGIADSPFLRTLLAIHQKSWVPGFWEVMDSFVLVAYTTLAASGTLLQQLLACLNFPFNSKDLFC